MPADVSPDELTRLRRRVEILEAENQNLREQVEQIQPLAAGPPNPCFSPREFQKRYQRVMLWTLVPVYLLSGLFVLLPMRQVQRYVPRVRVLGLPLIDVAGIGTRHPGIGVGIVAFGGV